MTGIIRECHILLSLFCFRDLGTWCFNQAMSHKAKKRPYETHNDPPRPATSCKLGRTKRSGGLRKPAWDFLWLGTETLWVCTFLEQMQTDVLISHRTSSPRTYLLCITVTSHKISKFWHIFLWYISLSIKILKTYKMEHEEFVQREYMESKGSSHTSSCYLQQMATYSFQTSTYIKIE